MHSTNYYNHFIEIAEDANAEAGEMPPMRGEKKSVANYQFDMLYENPYQYTSDDVIFTVHATRKEVPNHLMEEARTEFFSKGQPCFRASPLTKRYGWGVHSDAEGRIAHGAGSLSLEEGAITHWWLNEGTEDVRLIAFDVFNAGADDMLMRAAPEAQ
ncbi:MAG: DUF6157 family protein, partial [Bacteroidota bacterium]